MIILVVNHMGVLAIKAERHPPIAGNFDRSMVFEISLELVQSRTGKVHALDTDSSIKPVQKLFQLDGVFRLNAFGRSGQKP